MTEESFGWGDAAGVSGDPDPTVTILDPCGDWMDFLTRYCKDGVSEVKNDRSKSLLISYVDVVSWDPDKSDDLLYNPDSVIPYIKDALVALVCRGRDISEHQKNQYQSSIIRIKDLPKSVLIRDIRDDKIDQLIQIEGLIRNASTVLPRLVRSAWRCNRANCGSISYIQQETGPITRPEECPGCTNTSNFTLIKRLCTLNSSQRFVIQERPEGLKGGDLPKDITVEFSGDVCGLATAGSHIKVSGVLRSYQSLNKNSPYFDYMIEGLYFEISQKEYEDIDLTDEDIEQIKELASNPEIHTILRDSISPDIKGNEAIKAAISCQLFGGVTKKKPDGGRLRGDIHILLVTDPSCGKSQMMRYVSRLAPRAVMAVGGGSSAAGLTASAVKSEIDGSWTLEAGALVLADNGIALIDEAEKMHAQDRAAIHEALEDGTVSVNKAGINATLKARCSSLMAANPDKGRFDENISVGEQINLPPSLLSRFDLIFTMSDRAEINKDIGIADHILLVHQICSMMEAGIEVDEDELSIISPEIPPELFRKYVAYAKQLPPPVLSSDAKKVIKQYYTSLREKAGKQQKAVPVTARQMEGMIRLAEASAKIRLSSVVSVDDATRAVSMMDACLKGIAYDPETGDIDWDKMANKTSSSKRDKIKSAISKVRELCEERGFCYEKDYYEAMESNGVSKTNAEDLLDTLHKSCEVTISGGKIRPL